MGALSRRALYVIGLIAVAAALWGRQTPPMARAVDQAPRPQVGEAPILEPASASAAIPPGVPARPTPWARASVPDSIAAFVERFRFSPRQQDLLRRFGEEKELDLEALQREVFEDGLRDLKEVRRRAEGIQSIFESQLNSVVTAEEFRQYLSLKRAGIVGTYVIVIPGDAYRAGR